MNRRAVSIGAASLVAFVAVSVLAVRTEAGQRADETVFGGVLRLARDLHPEAAVLRTAVPLACAVGVLVVLVVALRRRRWLDVLTALTQAGVAVAASRLVRDVVLHRPDLGVGGYARNTLPSTHATATAALCAAALILLPAATAPRGAAPAASGPSPADLAIAGAFVALGGFGSVASWAHRPADVVASTLLVTGLAAFAVAGRDALAALSARRRRAARPS